MQFEISNILTKDLNSDYKVIINNSIISERINNRVNELRPKINIKGFRKGNVPSNVIIEKYGQSLLAEESEKLANEAIKKIIDDNKIKIATRPKIDIKELKLNEDLEFTVFLELFPTIPDIELNKIKITFREADITENDINENIDKLAINFSESQEAQPSHKAKIDDIVNIDYVGCIDNIEFDGGSAKGHKLVLGSNSFIDNFESQLVGKKAGDEVVVKVKFPKNYHNYEFRGKAAKFNVKINNIEVINKLELTDKIVKDKFGLDDISKLRENVSKNLTDSYNNISTNLYKKELYDIFIKKYSFMLPEGIIEMQFKHLYQDIEEQIKKNPNLFKSEKEINKEREKQRDIAIRTITAGYIISDISKKNNIEPTQEDITNEFQKIMAQYPGQQQQVMKYYQENPDAINNIKEIITERKVIEFIIDNSSTVKKKTSITDIDKLWQKANEE